MCWAGSACRPGPCSRASVTPFEKVRLAQLTAREKNRLQPERLIENDNIRYRSRLKPPALSLAQKIRGIASRHHREIANARTDLPDNPRTLEHRDRRARESAIRKPRSAIDDS